MAEDKESIAISKEMTEIISGDGFKEIPKGFFNNVPDLSGHVYEFKSDKTNTTFLIINTNPDFQYPNEEVTFDDYQFFVINAESVEGARDKIKYLVPKLIRIIKEKNQDRDRSLPYGYDKDKDGNIVVNPMEADEVKKIFKAFPNVRSIRKVANGLRTNFSHVREILHDDRYQNMYPQIVSPLELKKTQQILYQNRKNRTTGKESKMAQIKAQIASGLRK